MFLFARVRRTSPQPTNYAFGIATPSPVTRVLRQSVRTIVRKLQVGAKFLRNILEQIMRPRGERPRIMRPLSRCTSGPARTPAALTLAPAPPRYRLGARAPPPAEDLCRIKGHLRGPRRDSNRCPFAVTLSLYGLLNLKGMMKAGFTVTILKPKDSLFSRCFLLRSYIVKLNEVETSEKKMVASFFGMAEDEQRDIDIGGPHDGRVPTADDCHQGHQIVISSSGANTSISSPHPQPTLKPPKSETQKTRKRRKTAHPRFPVVPKDTLP
ncbi:hypothetical protein EVAR_23048_1 [Eumeta japonica]|uniref:Uncharacterized protein n=1 Tax=Eumeta variegata TaxID=151549 RepID=A0A4C1VM38_EUMVA|nr:hypothetical protein EVAR_23048_1 [Eumeta japonica]